HAFFARDSIVVTPQLRYSNIKGSVFDFFTFSEVSPGRFFEYGLNVAYNYQLTDHVLLSAEALGRERQFRDAHRSDTYFAPAASVTFQNVLPCTCDIKARYQHRNNNSDDSFATYDADQVSLSLIARF
ncbi:MAG: outer membrane beta-barrel protein, partial [Proteobacteria bacterium]|nr:outer membrane beta-barrel protein [Pseudomonadota bacterium]